MSPTRKTTTPSKAAPNLALIIGVVAAVLVLAVFAVVLTGDDGGGGAGEAATPEQKLEEYGVVTVDGQLLPPIPSDGADPAVGSKAPAVLSERPSDSDRIAPGEDPRPTMIVFLAHWCPHCQRELPLLVQMAEDGAFEGVDTVAVATSTTDTRPNFPPSAWLDEEGWTGHRFFDDEQATAAAAYGLTSFPMIVFVDEDGVVTRRITGEQPAEVIEAAIAEMKG